LSGGDLHARKPYSETQAAAIMKQVLRALNYIHGRNFVHLDIKFENIMFVNKEPTSLVKIIDFGFAQRLDPTNTRGLVQKQLGTFDTMSPEVFSGNYTTKADLWSAGVVTYQLLCDHKPFAAMTPMGVIAKISKGTYSLTDYGWDKKSSEAKQFVNALLTRNPDHRPSAKEALEDKWFDVCLREMQGNTNDGLETTDTLVSPAGAQIHNSLKLYARAPILKKIGLLLIAHKAFPDEVTQLQQQFERFDVDDTGAITVQEFQQALRAIDKSADFNQEEIERIFQSMDAYGDGTVAYTEFLAALLEGHLNITEDRIADAFEQIDISETGSITKEDLRLLLGKDFSSDYVENMIKQVDLDQSGQSRSIVNF
jgi:calcium-dependent protein kinase